jgi:RHS repeat-associated protein
VYLHHDQLGSTRLVTDSAGNSVASYTWDPYGKLSASTGNAAVTRLGFAGQYTDPETGFEYLRARYYDPGTAQFLTRDPLVALTVDPYGYAAGSPLNFTDPTGMSVGSWFEEKWDNFTCGITQVKNWIGNHSQQINTVLNVVLVTAISVLLPELALPLLDDLLFGDLALEGGVDAVEGGSEASLPEVKSGSAGGDTAGKRFPPGVRNSTLQENPGTCVYCHMETDSPQVDHAIPRSRGGNATADNAQTTCGHCNASKGARDVPVTPPSGYRGPWPPPWWISG